MAQIFYTLIKNGFKTMVDVPDHLKEEVQSLLDKNNV